MFALMVVDAILAHNRAKRKAELESVSKELRDDLDEYLKDWRNL